MALLKRRRGCFVEHAQLLRALQSFDAMPAQMKAQKSNVCIRGDIVREQGRKP